MASSPPALQQISLSLSTKTRTIAPASATSQQRRDQDLQSVRRYVEGCVGGGLPLQLIERHSPFNISMTPAFAAHVEEIHRLLDRALGDVVERWFKDAHAAFPSRMPLEPHEEDLLRWIDGPGSNMVPAFASRYGIWRTDFLIEKDAAGVEHARICEINGRLPFNGLWVSGLHEEATKHLRAGAKDFDSPNNFAVTKDTVISCFNREKPLYNIRSKWPGIDSGPLGVCYYNCTGQPMVNIQPSELHLEVDDTSATGCSLWYVPEERDRENKPSEKLRQRIDQCTMELYQEEIAQIDPLILRQLATNCVNDFRTIFLCHDKRILRILVEELPSLVQRKRLSPREATQLEAAIATTLLPGTKRLRSLLEQSCDDQQQKNNYIIKSIRDGSGSGIRLGKYLTQEEWLATLERLSQRPLRPHEEACVVQKLVQHVQYDILRHDVQSMPGGEQFHLIGSGHMINSRLYVHGPWRIGQDVHVGLGPENKGILMSAVLRPELPSLE